jgi:hypothetical protein
MSSRSRTESFGRATFFAALLGSSLACNSGEGGTAGGSGGLDAQASGGAIATGGAALGGASTGGASMGGSALGGAAPGSGGAVGLGGGMTGGMSGVGGASSGGSGGPTTGGVAGSGGMTPAVGGAPVTGGASAVGGAMDTGGSAGSMASLGGAATGGSDTGGAAGSMAALGGAAGSTASLGGAAGSTPAEGGTTACGEHVVSLAANGTGAESDAAYANVEIDLQSDLPTGNSPRTIEFWAFIRSTDWVGETNEIYYYGGSANAGAFGLDFGTYTVSGSTSNHATLDPITGGGFNDDSTNDLGIDSATDQWVHVAMVWDGSALLTYVNGQLKITTTGSGGVTALAARPRVQPNQPGLLRRLLRRAQGVERGAQRGRPRRELQPPLRR